MSSYLSSEGEIINRRPHFSMEDRLLLNKINYEDGTINLDGKIYKLKDCHFLTIDPENPYTLTIEEKELIEKLKASFLNSEKLQKHVRFLYSNGSMYLKFNSNLFQEFGLNPDVSHIINGHVPVKLEKGESPIRANGKILVIDGGFSRAHHGTTGIAGYTLIYNSYGLLLVFHDPFQSTQKAIEEEKDIHSTTMVLEREVERKRVRDTDDGEKLKH